MLIIKKKYSLTDRLLRSIQFDPIRNVRRSSKRKLTQAGSWTVHPLEGRLMLAGDLHCVTSSTVGDTTDVPPATGNDAEQNTRGSSTELVFIDLAVQQSSELASIVDRDAEIVLIDARSKQSPEIWGLRTITGLSKQLLRLLGAVRARGSVRPVSDCMALGTCRR